MSIFHNLKIFKVIRETSDAISVEFEVPSDLVLSGMTYFGLCRNN